MRELPNLTKLSSFFFFKFENKEQISPVDIPVFTCTSSNKIGKKITSTWKKSFQFLLRFLRKQIIYSLVTAEIFTENSVSKKKKHAIMHKEKVHLKIKMETRCLTTDKRLFEHGNGTSTKTVTRDLRYSCEINFNIG